MVSKIVAVLSVKWAGNPLLWGCCECLMGAVSQKNLAQLASITEYLFSSVHSPQAPTQPRLASLGLSQELGHREERRFLCMTWPFGAVLEDRPQASLLFRVGVIDNVSQLHLHSENVFAFFGTTKHKGALVIK